MLRGTVIFAHQDASMINGVMNMLSFNSPALQLHRASCGREAIRLQSVMRADAVLMGMNLPDMSGTHLLCELKRDIVDPYIMVCSREYSHESDRNILRLGANSVVHAPVNAAEICLRLETQIKERGESGFGSQLEENLLQRIFMDYGVSCSMNGYAYLKCAVRLLRSRTASIDAMSELYEMIAVRYASTAKNVERSIRYAIERCWEKKDEQQPRPGNKEFLIKLMEECRGGRQTILKPRISILTSGRRVFG